MTKLCLAHILCKCSAEFIGGLGKKSCGGLEGLGKQLCTIIALYHHVLEQNIISEIKLAMTSLCQHSTCATHSMSGLWLGHS